MRLSRRLRIILISSLLLVLIASASYIGYQIVLNSQAPDDSQAGGGAGACVYGDNTNLPAWRGGGSDLCCENRGWVPANYTGTIPGGIAVGSQTGLTMNYNNSCNGGPCTYSPSQNVCVYKPDLSICGNPVSMYMGLWSASTESCNATKSGSACQNTPPGKVAICYVGTGGEGRCIYTAPEQCLWFSNSAQTGPGNILRCDCGCPTKEQVCAGKTGTQTSTCTNCKNPIVYQCDGPTPPPTTPTPAPQCPYVRTYGGVQVRAEAGGTFTAVSATARVVKSADAATSDEDIRITAYQCATDPNCTTQARAARVRVFRQVNGVNEANPAYERLYVGEPNSAYQRLVIPVADLQIGTYEVRIAHSDSVIRGLNAAGCAGVFTFEVVGPDATPTPTPSITPTPTTTPTPTPVAGLTLVKDSEAVCEANTNNHVVNYTITLSNSNSTVLSYSQLIDTILSEVDDIEIAGITGGGVLSGQVITWPAGTVPANGTATFTYSFTLTPAQAAELDNVLANQARVNFEVNGEPTQITFNRNTDLFCAPRTGLKEDLMLVAAAVLIVFGIIAYRRRTGSGMMLDLFGNTRGRIVDIFGDYESGASRKRFESDILAEAEANEDEQ